MKVPANIELEERVQSAPVPEAMRRLPKQERSRRVVDTIVTAALAILQSHGREGLSTTSLELVADVPKSTIYEYFPNLDAVVTEVFHYTVRQHQQAGTACRAQLAEPQTLLEFTDWLVHWALGIHDALLALDAQFYKRYSGYYDLWYLLDECLQPDTTTERFLLEQIRACVDYESSQCDVMYAHALGRSAQLMSYAMLRDNPEFRRQPGFGEMLVRSSYAIFKN